MCTEIVRSNYWKDIFLAPPPEFLICKIWLDAQEFALEQEPLMILMQMCCAAHIFLRVYI